MMGMRSALVLTVLLAALGCFGGATVAASDELPAQSNIVADNQPTPNASLRKRAEELARAASERFSEIMAGGRKSKVAQDVAQGTVPEAQGAPRSPGAADDAFSPVRGWLARSAKDYEDVIIAKLKNPSGDVLILAPQGTVVAQKDAVPEVPDKKVPELPGTRATEPKAGWSWDRVMEASRDWLARANRSYRNEIVKKLVRPEQPQTPNAAAQWRDGEQRQSRPRGRQHGHCSATSRKQQLAPIDRIDLTKFLSIPLLGIQGADNTIHQTGRSQFVRRNQT